MVGSEIVTAVSIPIIVRAVDFLFGQAKDILKERRERRKEQEVSASGDQESAEERTHKIVLADSITTKEEALERSIDVHIWHDSEREITNLIDLLDIYTVNYYNAKKKYARWGSSMVPQVIVHDLEEAERQVEETTRQLERALSKVYEKSSQLHPVSNGEADEEDEKGFLDFFIEGQKANEDISAVAEEFTVALEELGQKTEEHSERFTRLSGTGDAKAYQTVALQVAGDMNRFSENVSDYDRRLDDGISRLRESVSGLILWMQARPSENREAFETYRSELVGVNVSVSQTSDELERFLDAVRGLQEQKINRAVNRACSRLIATVASMVKTLDALTDFCLNAVETIDETLEAE